MSDIAVRKLAEMINAPVEVLLKQLQDAGISVDGPDAYITDDQKLTLLAHIRKGAAAPSKGNSTGGKITLKRRSTSDVGNRGAKTVNVEVRRKKTFAPGAAKPATSSASVAPATGGEGVSRTEELARQLAAERQAREAAVQRAEQERRELEARRLRKAREDEAAAIAETASPEVIEASPEPQPEAAAEPEQPKSTETAAAPETTAAADDADTGEAAEPEKKVAAPTPEPSTGARTEKPETRTTTTAVDEIIPPGNLQQQRAAVADAARKEAAAALKRRPSKPKPKPKSLAPRSTIDGTEDQKADSNSDKYAAVERSTEKQAAKKPPAKTRQHGNREELHVSPGNRRGKKKGGRQDNRARGGVRSNVPSATTAKHGFEKPTAPVVREIEIPPTIVVSDLAQKLAIRATDIIKSMMKMGMMVTINQSVDQDTAILVTEELGHKAKPMQEMDDAAMLAAMVDQNTDYDEHTRPPVVTIMGHVDHGKTSLLDYIRATRVAAGEAGGITQHIGAYHVDTDHGTVTFLDTPGHAAFTKMRARGAQVTDIVILIVAADDGVMPQTKEAIQHARAAEVPMVVVINKIDKEDADPDRVLNELSQHEVLTEEWGGDVPVVRVSAKTGQGIDDLLETLLLVAEVQELTSPVEAPARGNVIEASIEKGRGAVATILVRSGTLRKGDLLLCGTEYGRVRAMFDERGRPVKEAGPSIPVAVLGLSAAPEAGEEVVALDDERKAREIAELRREKQRDSRFAEQQSAKLDNLFDQMKSGAKAQVNLLVKADVQGSVEAIRSELIKLANDEIDVRVISSGVGGINESDVDLAAASKAIMIAFNVRADATARKTAAEEGVEIRYYSIIYDVINDVKEAMSGMLSPEVREVFIGLAEVRDVFRSSAFGQVAGCLVVDGTVKRGNPIRVLRDNVVIFEGELESLRRHRDDVKEVPNGTECGIAIKDYNDVRAGDNIECYERIEVARKV